MDTNRLKIKKHLESIYDIPFVVQVLREYNDLLYKISPENDMNELFDVSILFRQNIRLIIEIQPQKYAAGLLEEMQNADKHKRSLFLQYLNIFRLKNTKVETIINDNVYNPEDDYMWNVRWNKFKLRATRITVNETEQPDFDQVIETMEWASLSVGLILSLLNVEYLDDENKRYAEGKVSQTLTTKYERNPVNRELCLAANGYTCKVCEMDFFKTYGDLGYHFIHVHHIEMVSSFGGEYFINPEKDLIPVCPNCHAMLHRLNPPMKPEDLKEIISSNKEQ
jgi:5-methylcytosine-specific restriction enzyme A